MFCTALQKTEQPKTYVSLRTSPQTGVAIRSFNSLKLAVQFLNCGVSTLRFQKCITAVGCGAKLITARQIQKIINARTERCGQKSVKNRISLVYLSLCRSRLKLYTQLQDADASR